MPTAGPVTEPRIDPTGQRVAYVSDGALHVAELADGSSRTLAVPEHADVSYGLAEHVAAESMLRYRGFWWAPDGRELLAARVDNSPVQQWWIADPANPERQPRAIRYPAAGTANADVTLHVLRLDGTRTEVGWDRTAFEYLATASWDSTRPAAPVQSRDQRTVLILAADPVTGATAVLHEERDPAWVDSPTARRCGPSQAAWCACPTRATPASRRRLHPGHARRTTGPRGLRRRRRGGLLRRPPGADRGAPLALRPARRPRPADRCIRACTTAARPAAPWSESPAPRRGRRSPRPGRARPPARHRLPGRRADPQAGNHLADGGRAGAAGSPAAALLVPNPACGCRC